MIKFFKKLFIKKEEVKEVYTKSKISERVEIVANTVNDFDGMYEGRITAYSSHCRICPFNYLHKVTIRIPLVSGDDSIEMIRIFSIMSSIGLNFTYVVCEENGGDYVFYTTTRAQNWIEFKRHMESHNYGYEIIDHIVAAIDCRMYTWDIIPESRLYKDSDNNVIAGLSVDFYECGNKVLSNAIEYSSITIYIKNLDGEVMKRLLAKLSDPEMVIGSFCKSFIDQQDSYTFLFLSLSINKIHELIGYIRTFEDEFKPYLADAFTALYKMDDDIKFLLENKRFDVTSSSLKMVSEVEGEYFYENIDEILD